MPEVVTVVAVRPRPHDLPGAVAHVAHPQVAALKDLNGREATVLGLLALAVLGMGVYPFPFTDDTGVIVLFIFTLKQGKQLTCQRRLAKW